MSPTRAALLDAAADVVLAGEWGRVRMLDVARAAGVSRQTLYAEFGSKDGLAQALAVREAEAFIAGAVAARTGFEGGPAEAVAAEARQTLEAAAGNPLLKAVLTDDAAGLLPFLTSRAGAVQALSVAHLSDFLLGTWPHLPPRDVALVADVVTRLVISHLVLPGRRPDEVADDIAHLVHRLLEEKP